MSNTKLSSHDRQRLRREAVAAVAPLPIPFALEAVAARLDVREGRFAVRFSEGYLQHVTRSRVIDPNSERIVSLPPVTNMAELVEAAAKAFGVRDGALVLDIERDKTVSAVTIKEAFSAAALMERTLVPSGRMGLPREEW